MSGGNDGGATDVGRIVLHKTTAARAFAVNVDAGIVDGSGLVGAHFVDGLVNMRVVSVETLHDLVDLEDLQHANTFVTYVQHSAVVEQLKNNCRTDDGVMNRHKRHRRQQLLKIPNRMTELLSRVTANLNCYNNAQRQRRHRQQQQQQQQAQSDNVPSHGPQQQQHQN